MTNKLFLSASFLVLSLYGFSQVQQDSIVKVETVVSEVKDSIIDGKPIFKDNTIPVVVDSLNLNPLEDLPEVAELEEKWLEELYSNSLFDTIYKSVTELEYDPIDYPELPTDTLKARLERLNSRTPFNVEYNSSLENVIKRYLKYRRSTMERLMGLSHFYFPMFEREFDNYDIPLEMKYLSIVESALKPRARSRVGATGLWQFMFTTGKEYKLDVSSYVDDRRDPIKSTTAAAQYLSRLYKIFGDWDLALAAYNSGPGNVNKAIRRSGGYKNYWNIRQSLPRETAGYVPAFLATMYIFEFAEEHGFKPERPIFQHIQTDTIHVKEMISLDQISETTGVNIEELQFLNPSYKLDIIPKVEGETYILRLPREAIGIFTANEDKIYAFAKDEFNKREKPLPKLINSDTKITYRVRSGDYLGKISRKYGVRVSQIKRWNGLRSNNLKIGQRLTIYPRNLSESSSTKQSKKVVSTVGKKTYKVKAGDSLWTISEKFSGVSVQNIKEWNGISGNKIKIGMTLVVSQ